jgi:L-alanine-DL-glutamate epimerase-like enolase superfamily enzyme
MTQVEAIDTVCCTVPTDLPEADGTLAWDSTTVVVVRVSADGVTGLGYTYGTEACATLVTEVLADVVRGTDPLCGRGTWEAMDRAVRNVGRAGVGPHATTALDLALWDLRARLLDVPLHRLVGPVRDEVPVYGSGGFTTYTDEQLTAQLRDFLDLGVRDVKIKIGEDWGRREERDRARIRQAREVIGPERGLFVDANGAYAPQQAVRLLDDVAEARVSWIEEPVTSEDLAGLRHVRERVSADVAAGEYAWTIADVDRLAGSGAVDCLQLDVTRCGGITGWLRAAAVAAAHHLPLSGHCAATASLAPALATGGLRHLEWFHDHARIEQLLFAGAPVPTDGVLRPAEAPGNGLVLREDAAEELRTRPTAHGGGGR